MCYNKHMTGGNIDKRTELHVGNLTITAKPGESNINPNDWDQAKDFTRAQDALTVQEKLREQRLAIAALARRIYNFFLNK